MLRTENPCGSNPGAHICIVTPGQIGSNPRVVKEAQALHDAGFKVTVIATRTLDSVEPRDQSILLQAKWRLKRIDLRSKPLWKLRRLRQLAFNAIYAATGSNALAVRAFSPFVQPLEAVAMGTQADLYIAHYPAALPVAAAAAKRYRAHYAYDAEDFHLGDWPDNPTFDANRKILRSIEGRYLTNCSHVTAAAPGIADAYTEVYGIERPQVILNVFPLVQAPSHSTARGSANPRPSVYWFSQVVGPNRGLECAVQAIGRARSRPHLYLRGNCSAEFAADLDRLAAESNATGRVHMLSPDIPDRMERLAATYDVGLVGELPQTRNRDIALTNKLFTYFLAGIPAVMSCTIAHRAFAAETDTEAHLFPPNNPEALAAVLDSLLENPARLAEARSKAYRLGRERFNWDVESHTLTAIVRRSLRGQQTCNL